jgi:hypothetical protein
MNQQFFIMLNSQSGCNIMPLVTEDNEVAVFPSEEAAREVADNHPYCQAFGFEIFEVGTGIY